MAAPLPHSHLSPAHCTHAHPQLRTVVPLLVRLMRAPRLGTARAATLALKDLLV